MNNNLIFKYTLISFIYLELIFKIINGLNIFDISTVFVVVIATLFALFFGLAIDYLNRKGRIISISLVLFLFGLYNSVHTCLYKFYKFYFQFSTLALADQAASFASDGIQIVLNNILYIVLYFVPLLLFIFYFKKYINEERLSIGLPKYVILICLLIFIPVELISGDYVSNTFQSNNMIQIVNKNGVLSGLLYDVLLPKDSAIEEIEIIEEEPIETIEEEIIVYGNNSFDIDFSALNEKTNDKNIIELNDYFANKLPTSKNEYTSFFEGKNLILFMAESFNGIAINEELTPTLYKLAHNGFEFNNFYTPTIYSTIGGEFCELTSLIPELGSSPNSLYIFRTGSNEYPMGIGNLFKEKGYNTYAYHDSTYNFQDRDVYLNSLGFDYYNASGLGLEYLMDIRHWPASDVDMINATFDDYINDDNFMVFYATVSGHGPYTFNKSDDSISGKYKDLLKEYYGDSLGSGKTAEYLMAYEAGQIELDRALQTLIEKLEASGKLEDTVIALVGDHHPYYLTERISMDDYNKLSSYERDPYIELYHSNFILYNSTMDKVTIDKVGGQLDVLPTLYNLFGLDYDSRLLIGVDLLSSSQAIVITADGSWVNDYGKYYSRNNTSESKKGNELSESYVDLINKRINNMKKISKLILRTNYYKFIYENK